MTPEQHAIYDEGYLAYSLTEGEEEPFNPCTGLDAEFWSDGWEDAKEDSQ